MEKETHIHPRYTVTEEGDVYTINKGNKLKMQTTVRGVYPRVRMRVDGKIKNVSVHRLVAIAFIPNPQNKPQVNHINGIKTDNRGENLEWCNNSENLRHAYRVMKVVPHSVGKFGILHHNSIPIIQMDLDGIFIAEHAAVAEAARIVGANRTGIIKVLKGRGASSGGYTWKYKEEANV